MVAHETYVYAYHKEPVEWDVGCRCGFEVIGLSTQEAADDAANWHLGRPSLLGRYDQETDK